MKNHFISGNTLLFLFVIASASLISTNLLMYMRINDGQIKTETILDSQSKIHTLQNISSILLHDHIHSENLTARKSVDSLIKSLLSGNDTEDKSIYELYNLAQQRLEYLNNTNTANIRDKQKKTILKEEQIRNNISKIKSLISGLISNETQNSDLLLKKNHSSALFTYYISVIGLIISIIIFSVVFIIQRRNINTSVTDTKEIPYEELEAIVKDRTTEIARINLILNQKINQINKIDNELKHTMQYYKAMFEHAHDPIVVISTEDKTVLEVNDKASDIYGFC